MDRIFRNILFQGKNFYRDKSFIFWCLTYPIIMAIFFYIAFNGIMNIEFKNIDVGIEKENPIRIVLDNIDILNIHIVSEEDSIDKLNNGDIQGFIDNNLNLTVKKSGINQTIIKQIVDQIKQMSKLDVPFEKFDFKTNYIINKNQKSDAIIIIFYSLIGMVSVYGVFPGIEITTIIQSNLSYVAKRMNVSPLRKSEFIFSGIIISLFLNIVSNTLLLLFIHYVLKLKLLTNLGLSVLLIFVGNLFGITLGIFIGVSNKLKRNTKTILSIAITLGLSFFAGMMNPDIKIMIDKNIPLLGKINPISILTNNLYRINLLDYTKGVDIGIYTMLGWIIVLNSISYIFLRRKTYDSI